MTRTPATGSSVAPTVQPKRTRRWLRVLRRWFFILTGIYVVYLTALYFLQDQMVFPTQMIPRSAAGGVPAGAERLTVEIPVRDAKIGEVEAWLFLAPGASAAKPAPLVIFFHGNAELIDQQDERVSGYLNLGCSVLLPEYRGYGHSAGKPSEKAIATDMIRFYDLAAARPEVDRQHIVIHGRSLGGGVAADLARSRRPSAFILESTFTSAAAMAHHYGAPQWLVANPFRTDLVVPTLEAPVLVMSGTHDELFPPAHGRQLAQLARHGTYAEFDAHHNDFPGAGQTQRYWDTIERFLRSAGVPASSRGVATGGGLTSTGVLNH